MERKPLVTRREPGAVEARREPPVVARLVLELRSDGSRTIARGVAEDVGRGERVVIDAEGANPLALALALLRSLAQIPALARSFTGGLLGPRKPPR